MVLVGVAVLIAGVVMLVKARKHSSQPPPPGTDHSEMKRNEETPAAPEVHNQQDTQTDECTKHYQELDLATMERKEYASIKI